MLSGDNGCRPFPLYASEWLPSAVSQVELAEPGGVPSLSPAHQKEPGAEQRLLGLAATESPVGSLRLEIRDLRDRINQRPFRKRAGSRASQFVELDKPALKPLPPEPFDLSQWSRACVNIDYHIAFDSNYYSVPYNLEHVPYCRNHV